MAITTNGSCLCRAVTYRVIGPLRPVIACHCVQCRKTSGHHVAATSAPRDAVAITGRVTWYASSADAKRGFCGTCGSQLFWNGPGQNLSIFAGSLDDADGLKLEAHIFCADKGAYYNLNDGLPQAQQDDPTMTTQVPDL